MIGEPTDARSIFLSDPNVSEIAEGDTSLVVVRMPGQLDWRGIGGHAEWKPEDGENGKERSDRCASDHDHTSGHGNGKL